MPANIQRVIDRLNALGSISDEGHCISRFFMTNAHGVAGKMIADWMKSAEMSVQTDTIGNVKGVLQSSHPEAKHFVIGSHYDSVFNAGKYDGPLGIILGIEVAQRIVDENIELPFHLTVIAFADEEGARFNTAYLGSSAIAGNFDTSWLDRKDDEGTSLRDVLIKNHKNPAEISKNSIPEKDWLGYFEVHIEQGPVLCEANLPICLVSGIAAQTRIDIEWIGVNGHAGTSPMHLRNDAFCGAAEFAMAVETMALEHKEQLVATIGKCTVHPNTSNVIPGHVAHSLDIRSPDDTLLVTLLKTLKEQAQYIAKRRNLTLQWNVMQANTAVACDSEFKKMLASSIEKAKVPTVLEIPSGAGHDGVMISKVAPITMLFVRCKEGISHHPEEYASPQDIEAALIACHHFIDTLIATQRTKLTTSL